MISFWVRFSLFLTKIMQIKKNKIYYTIIGKILTLWELDFSIVIESSFVLSKRFNSV